MDLKTFAELMKFYPVAEALKLLGLGDRGIDFFMRLIKNGCPVSAIIDTLKEYQKTNTETEDDT